MKALVFVQSEALEEIGAVELESEIGGAGLRARLLEALPAIPDTPEMVLYIEDDDDEGAASRLGEIPHGLRVHFHRIKGIDVTVRYAGREVSRTFRPSSTIARVKAWAVDAMGINHSDAAELMLQVVGTTIRPDGDVHIGSLVKAPLKVLVLDLVPSHRVNG